MHIASIAPDTLKASAAIGSATAAVIEPSETLRLNLTTAKKTAMTMQNTSGCVIMPRAAPTDTPLPPRKEKNRK